jgi:hypothetical protein
MPFQMTLPEPGTLPSILHLHCPRSSGDYGCHGCKTLISKGMIDLPHKPHPAHKPRRASSAPVCPKVIIERFPPEYRPIIMEILADRGRSAHKLDGLIVYYRGEGSHFGCPCCPKARFQSGSKVKDHLRGQLGMRPYRCKYW